MPPPMHTSTLFSCSMFRRLDPVTAGVLWSTNCAAFTRHIPSRSRLHGHKCSGAETPPPSQEPHRWTLPHCLHHRKRERVLDPTVCILPVLHCLSRAPSRSATRLTPCGHLAARSPSPWRPVESERSFRWYDHSQPLARQLCNYASFHRTCYWGTPSHRIRRRRAC